MKNSVLLRCRNALSSIAAISVTRHVAFAQDENNDVGNTLGITSKYSSELNCTHTRTSRILENDGRPGGQVFDKNSAPSAEQDEADAGESTDGKVGVGGREHRTMQI